MPTPDIQALTGGVGALPRTLTNFCGFAAGLQAPSSPITTWPVLAVVCPTYAPCSCVLAVPSHQHCVCCFPSRCILNTAQCTGFPPLSINAGVVYGNGQIYLGWSGYCGGGTAGRLKIQGLFLRVVCCCCCVFTLSSLLSRWFC